MEDDSKAAAEDLVGKKISVKLALHSDKFRTYKGLVRRVEQDSADNSWQVSVMHPELGAEHIYYVNDLILSKEGRPLTNARRTGEHHRPIDPSIHIEVLDSTNREEIKREADSLYEKRYFAGGCRRGKDILSAATGPQGIVQTRIAVWWPAEQRWYEGDVSTIKPASSNGQAQPPVMTVVYEDGDIDDVSVSSVWRLADTAPSEGPNQAAGANALALMPQRKVEQRLKGLALVAEADTLNVNLRVVDAPDGSVEVQAAVGGRLSGTSQAGEKLGLVVEQQNDRALVLSSKCLRETDGQVLETDMVIFTEDTFDPSAVEVETDADAPLGPLRVFIPRKDVKMKMEGKTGAA